MSSRMKKRGGSRLRRGMTVLCVVTRQEEEKRADNDCKVASDEEPFTKMSDDGDADS
jgi:hypothetical protein